MKKNIKAMEAKLENVNHQIETITSHLTDNNFDGINVIGLKINSREELVDFLKFQMLRYESIKKAMVLEDFEIEQTLERMKNSMCKSCQELIRTNAGLNPCAKDFKLYSIYYTIFKRMMK